MHRRMALLLLPLLAAATQASAAGTAFAPASLSPPANLVSNPSFEATQDGRPSAFDLFALPQFLHVTEATALHGARALLADVPAGTALEAAARQDVPACVGCTYELSAWVQVVEERGGEAGLVLQMRAADGTVLATQQTALRGTTDGWQQLSVRLTAPRRTALVTVGAPSVRGGMKVYYDAVRLSILAGRRGPVQPAAGDLQAVRTEPTWVQLHWVGTPGDYAVSYRHRSWPRNRWQEFGAVDTFTYSVVGLQWRTSYDFRVRRLWPGYLDENGRPATAPQDPPPTPILRVTTPLREPRKVGNLQLWPTVRLTTFPEGEQASPRLAGWKDALYAVESHREAIKVSKLKPDDLTVLSTHELAAAPTDPQWRQRVSDACVLADKLYVLCNLRREVAPASTPAETVAAPVTGAAVTDAGPAAHQFLITYDLQQEAIAGQPLPVTSAGAGAESWQGGLQVFRDQLWLMWGDVTSPGAPGVSRLLLAPLLENVTGEAYVWPQPAGGFLRDPGLSLFANELVLSFTDLAPRAQRPGYEPLSVVNFNGADFRSLRKLADLGRNGPAAGAQLGPNFHLVYSSDVAWSLYGGRFADLRLALLGPGAAGPDTVSYVDDMKYNVVGDITAHDNALYVVYEKLEQEPSTVVPSPHSYGTFIGRIDTAVRSTP